MYFYFCVVLHFKQSSVPCAEVFGTWFIGPLVIVYRVGFPQVSSTLPSH